MASADAGDMQGQHGWPGVMTPYGWQTNPSTLPNEHHPAHLAAQHYHAHMAEVRRTSEARERTPRPTGSGAAATGSLAVAGGRPAMTMTPPPGLEQVAHLIQVQTNMLQNYMQSQKADYHDPDAMIKQMDAATADIARTRLKKTKTLIGHWQTQKELFNKYEQLKDKAQMHAMLNSEASAKWQFTKSYKAVAQPQDVAMFNENDPIEEGGAAPRGPFDLEEAWCTMRKRHAQECWEFIQYHQKKSLEHYDDQITVEKFAGTIVDTATSKLRELGLRDEGYKAHVLNKLHLYSSYVYRKMVPESLSHIQREQEKRDKRKAALVQAEASYRSMDQKELLAAVVLEKEFAPRKLTHGKGKKTQFKVPASGALGYLVKDAEELRKRYNLQITEEDKPNPKPTGNGKGKGNQPTKPAAAASKPKDLKKKKGKGKGKDSQPEGKSKGKGKDKGKGKGKGKGAGKGTGTEKSNNRRPKNA
eukprot:TRINITY_DN21516_c0_g1_i1.p2 TRINITY_DN21516_c0_g1~~TRINITY_DN21516_c0_g1_i1.p2  ORF type:complete len:473 (-),score=131.38 TRINITY_DN21516_c0_g1_i1:1866-3284(-)